MSTAIQILSLFFTTGAFLLAFLIWWRVRRPGAQNLDQTLREELRQSREEAARYARELREEVAGAQAKSSEALVRTLHAGEEAQERRGKEIRQAVDEKLRQIQESNEKKLDAMRQTVDEKLHNTLEKRLGESFKLVSERLEAVQRGLGEMQVLANGVGDLKRVLGNVKERGTWGEYQLGAILGDILTPDQYAQNVCTKEGRESVEYAVKLPGKGGHSDQPVWLPIDSKFPKEAYERLVEASRHADADGVKAAADELRRNVTKMAKDIHEKYINPPQSTDFAILFLPTEGLYAEVLRQAGLHDELQQKHRVLVAGPTTLSAVLNSLRVGFQTLAIEERAGEVWNVLRAVKSEFGKFGDVLEKVKKQINTVSTTLEESSKRTRVMERKLREVEQLPGDSGRIVLTLPESAEEGSDDEDVEEDKGA